jgi:hypothetical protein
MVEPVNGPTDERQEEEDIDEIVQERQPFDLSSL